MKTKEELTPVFCVGYWMNGISGNNFFLVEEEKVIRRTQIQNEYSYDMDDPFCVFPEMKSKPIKVITSRYYITKTFSRDKAIQEAEKINAETGMKSVAYHYGFKERGFKPNDKREDKVIFQAISK